MPLQREDVNPNQGGAENGATPLHFAVMAGQEGVVEILLPREDISPNQEIPFSGDTPLWWAAENGHE